MPDGNIQPTKPIQILKGISNTIACDKWQKKKENQNFKKKKNRKKNTEQQKVMDKPEILTDENDFISIDYRA
jgi:glycogen synthase